MSKETTKLVRIKDNTDDIILKGIIDRSGIIEVESSKLFDFAEGERMPLSDLINYMTDQNIRSEMFIIC